MTDEIDLEDAIGIASLNVAAGRAPAATEWVDGLAEREAERAGAKANEAFAESFF